MAVIDILFIPLIITLGFLINRRVKQNLPYIQLKVLDRLLMFHFAMVLVYYLYAQFNSSDSDYYYYKVINDFRGSGWFDYYDTGTPFIEFIGWPFIKLFGVGYEGIMVLFGLFGYVGILFFYLLFVENIRFSHYFYGVSLFPWVLFLPNMHFWSASFGKGSVILAGIAMFFYGLYRLGPRWPLVALGFAITYHVRPHIAFVLVAATGLSVLLGSRGIKPTQKIVAFFIMAVAFAFIYDKVFAYVGLEEENFESVEDFAGKYVYELGKAGSSVDISSYNLLQKMGTFLFRPLFLDANGALGLIVSFENVFYVFLLIQALKGGFIKFIWKADFVTKTMLFSFIASSAALSQITANLGIAIRMKAMIMFLFIFVIMKFLDYKRQQIHQIQMRKYIKARRVKKRALVMSS
jgi:hypothetical protein